MRTVGETIDTLIRIKDKNKSALYVEELDALNNVCNLLEHNFTNDQYIRDVIKEGRVKPRIEYPRRNWMFDKLLAHVGHHVTCVYYGDKDDPADVCIECEDCNEVLVSGEDFDEEE